MAGEDWVNSIHQGDAIETLQEIPESSIHMCMTSPPYYGLRDYGVDGQMGLEETLEEYIQNLVSVGREIRRVLRGDGSWWLNLGDQYQEKDKMLTPHRVALALQDEGWLVRNDVTWVKPNPMPSSVTDRLNTTTEQVFHLVPEQDYWYDLDAIREPHKESSRSRSQYEYNTAGNGSTEMPTEDREDVSIDQGDDLHPIGKNPGDVFEVTTKPFPEAHFAVYPPELVEKPLKATCPPRVCAACGAPYERDVDREPGEYDYSERAEKIGNGQQASGEMKSPPTVRMKGWLQVCDCGTDETKSGIALDPFVGAGTTCLVAQEHDRRYVGIDISEEYVAMSRARLDDPVENPEYLEETDLNQGYVEDATEW